MPVWPQLDVTNLDATHFPAPRSVVGTMLALLMRFVLGGTCPMGNVRLRTVNHMANAFAL